MALVTPNFTDLVSVLSAQVLARGSTARGTINLGGGGTSMKFGAYLFIKMGRGGTTALSAGMDILVRRVLNNDTAAAGGVHPAAMPALLSSTAAAAGTTVNVDSAAGQAALNVASITGFAAGDIICIQDSGGGVTRLEWHRVSKTATGILTLDRNLQFAHTAAQADTVRNKSDVFGPIWVPGGSLYEVIFDYGSQSTGDSATLQCLAQSYDSESVA